MFTGIVEECGAVLGTSGRRLVVSCRTVSEGSEVGSSVAVNGVCLTVVERGEGKLAFDVTEETLARSALGRLRPGHPVNLERPVTLLTRLSGHLMQGHVDGVGTVISLDLDGGGATMRVRAPAEVSRYLVEKGSVAVDGVSLTVAWLDPDGESFSIALIPHTLAVTTLGSARPGDTVNLEVDVIAKHVERLLERSGR